MRRSGPALLALLGLAGSGVGWWQAPGLFYHGWLAAVVAFAGWPLGSLALLFVHSLSGGRWGVAIRPALLGAVATMPLLLPAAVPLVIGLGRLYPWLAVPAAGLSNGFYLDASFFAGRVAVYLVIWLVLAGLVWRCGARDPALRRLAVPGLILLALTVTFAAIDLTEALDWHFNSSIWGMLTAASFALDALAVAILVSLALAQPAEPVRADLARLLLGLVILWAYLEFMQALIVWESDLPNDTGWYLPRIGGVWGVVAYGVALGHFAVPFCLLLSRRMQGSRRVLATAGGLVVASGILRWWWVVLPAGPGGLRWVDGAAVLGLAGCGMLLFRAALPETGCEVAHG
jgi:hypothetical protein